MNKEPKRQPEMLIEIGDKRLVCNPENTYGFLYEDTRFDHLFYVTEQNEDGSLNGYHLWRCMLEDMFDEAIHHMIATGYEVESLTEPDDNDKQAFFSKYKDQPETVPELPELGQHLQMRTNNDIAFMEYLLNEGRL